METLNPRRAAIAALAMTLPDRTLSEVLDDTRAYGLPPYAPSVIVPGLSQGGTRDHDVLSAPGDDFRLRGDYPFDTVVTLYASARPVPWGVEELRFGFLDAVLEGDDVEAVVRAARFAYDRWADGAAVLVRCQAGMNRSGLVTALVLMQAGLTPGQAISLIRSQRAASCLFNTDFVVWLMTGGGRALGLESGSSDAA